MSSIHDAITERRLGHPGVAAKLDRMSTNEVVGILGRPDREVRRYQEAPPIRLEDGTLGPAWTVGDGRPALATDDPAVVIAMNLCAVARNPWVVRNQINERHPGPCGWCDYPLLELHRAIAHATYFARLVRDHLLVWVGDDHELYIRAGEDDGRYQSQPWADLAALHAGEQRRRVADVIEAIREGAAA